MKEMAENDFDATIADSTNFKRRRTGESPQEAMVRLTKEKLQEILKKVNARGFQSRPLNEKISLLQEAGACLRQLKGHIPHDVFRSYYRTITAATRWLNDLSATDRRRRNKEETRLRLMGQPSPPEPLLPEPLLPEPSPPTQSLSTEQSARSAIRRIVNERALINQLSKANVLVRPVRPDGSQIAGMIIRAPKKKAGDLQFMMPSESERSKPSYERQISSC